MQRNVSVAFPEHCEDLFVQIRQLPCEAGELRGAVWLRIVLHGDEREMRAVIQSLRLRQEQLKFKLLVFQMQQQMLFRF